MTPSKALLVLLAFIFNISAHAREIAGISVPDSLTLAGQTLNLNGAGIRSKFIFDIYVGALYLASKTSDAKTAITMPGSKRILMHFLYDEVDKEKLTDGWNEGFENNLSDKNFNVLSTRLKDFNNLFITVKKGDVILLDYQPDKGTVVSINNALKGTIAGADFYQALLKVWLGEEPADEDLKQAMLAK